MLLDIHTHHLPSEAYTAILSCHLPDRPIPEQALYVSAGIHPWFLTEDTYSLQRAWLQQSLNDRRVIAIGEAGLDKCCLTPLSLQTEAFRFCATLAEERSIPLIIHAVKSFNELISLKKELHPHTPWIIHGFRGNKELAHSLTQQGFYLSFGEKFRQETLQSVPSHCILMETDDSMTDIHALYTQAAQLRHTAPAVFTAQVQDTIKNLFFDR